MLNYKTNLAPFHQFNASIRIRIQTEVFTSFNIPETSVAEKKKYKSVWP